MATAEKTKQYAEKQLENGAAASAYRRFGTTGLTVSCIGFGGYRAYNGSRMNRAALEQALTSGINLIDTSSNYTDGGSETLTGTVLAELVGAGTVSRDEIVLVTKAGYIQGKNMKIAEEREKDGKPFPETVKFMKEAWHCMHPDFLEDQLARSLERLQTDRIDVYLLHNPEYFLTESEKEEKDLEEARTEYYRRIRAAFEWMERKADEGKIGWYGVSSNTFPNKSTDYGFTSLERIYETAQDISPANRFRVAQFPLNVFEKEAAVVLNQAGDTKSVLGYAAEKGLAVMLNRPLNAVKNDTMVRLASFEKADTVTLKMDFRNFRDRVIRLEEQFANDFLNLTPREIPNENFIQVFTLGKQLTKALEGGFESREQWDHILHNMILPQSYYFIDLLKSVLKDNKELYQWADNYKDALLQFLRSISRYYDTLAEERSAEIGGILGGFAPSLKDSPTLSQMNIRLLASMPGVSTVLVGMRRPDYVRDAAGVLRADPVSEADAVKAVTEFKFKIKKPKKD